MKYVAFSFDDGRADTYEVAMPIMKKYGFWGTVNIISGFIINPQNYHFQSASRGMTAEEAIEWQNGGEIASHGSTHKNSIDEIITSIKEMESLGIDVNDIGFASPESWLTESNIRFSGIDDLLSNGTVSYLRSGIQIRREGLIYTALSIIERYTHSKWLFYILNKRNIIKGKCQVYPSAAVKDFTALSQIKYLIDKVGNGEALILMFHSILPKGNEFYGSDHYYWDAEYFDQLCQWLKGRNEVSILTVRDLIKRIER